MNEISWRKYRLKEHCKNAWMWCKNNNLTFFENGEEVVDHKTMENASRGFNLAEGVFFSYKYRRDNK